MIIQCTFIWNYWSFLNRNYFIMYTMYKYIKINSDLSKGPVTQRNCTNHTRVMHIFTFQRGACVICVSHRWTVIDCKWMCVEGGLCVILCFEQFKIVCVIYESACLVYASSICDYARDTRRPSVLIRQTWFKTAHVSRLFHWHSQACMFGRPLSVIQACVECSWNTTPYLLVCLDVRDMSVIRQLL